MLHNHTCNHYLVHLSDMTLRRPGDAEEMQSLIKCKIHVHVFGGGGGGPENHQQLYIVL